jgi:hypothetical protein
MQIANQISRSWGPSVGRCTITQPMVLLKTTRGPCRSTGIRQGGISSKLIYLKLSYTLIHTNRIETCLFLLLAQPKKKPATRNLVSLACLTLVVAKVHLFAYTLAGGIYQTWVAFMKWDKTIHKKTWELLLPDLPYKAETMDELEVVS